MKRRQFGEIRGRPTLWQQIEQTLIDAGFQAGHHHTGGGWSRWGPSTYEPPVPGYVIGEWIDHEAERIWRERWNEEAEEAANWNDPEWRVRFGNSHRTRFRHPQVDHAGKGRALFLPRYLEVLRHSGFTAKLHRLSPWASRKEIIVIFACKETSPSLPESSLDICVSI